METAELIAWVVFALIFVWLGMVLGATWRQMEGEAERAGIKRVAGRRREKQVRE